ncbi:unnamed protein product [Urochloa humidicola]
MASDPGRRRQSLGCAWEGWQLRQPDLLLADVGPIGRASAERRRPDVDPGAAIFPLTTASIQKERVLSCLQP